MNWTKATILRRITNILGPYGFRRNGQVYTRHIDEVSHHIFFGFEQHLDLLCVTAEVCATSAALRPIVDEHAKDEWIDAELRIDLERLPAAMQYESINTSKLRWSALRDSEDFETILSIESHLVNFAIPFLSLVSTTDGLVQVLSIRKIGLPLITWFSRRLIAARSEYLVFCWFGLIDSGEVSQQSFRASWTLTGMRSTED
ncbi:MAG: hypothetical protein HONBIEJF_02868 [Fimbriimonadaceae bacterium]|nr:hypothetical protein [Fimbriimonadaceae bacterium]